LFGMSFRDRARTHNAKCLSVAVFLLRFLIESAILRSRQWVGLMCIRLKKITDKVEDNNDSVR
jgi:hypothetical protein